jgi:NAD(P)-dependent dehydrogenase (short-subunit alcohol dehydrogenase family)
VTKRFKDKIAVIRVNLFGVYLCTKAFLPLLPKAGRGRILMMASTAGKAPAPFNTAYSASKHALLGLTKSLASGLAPSGYPEITANAICPFLLGQRCSQAPGGGMWLEWKRAWDRMVHVSITGRR